MGRHTRTTAVVLGLAMTVAGALAACELEQGGLPGTCACATDGGASDVAADVTPSDAGGGDAPVDAPPDAKPACPEGRGPKMVRLATSTAGAYCMDSTEVSFAEYGDYAEALVLDAGLPAPLDACKAKTTWSTGPTVSLSDVSKPAVYVDWCDAARFCAWAGKRLCTSAEYSAACSGSGAKPYPYGTTYDAGACNVATLGPERVGTRASCEGGYGGLYDLVGNVWDWTDDCTADAGLTDNCGARGGSYYDPSSPNVACAYGSAIGRSVAYPNVGFRCCAP